MSTTNPRNLESRWTEDLPELMTSGATAWTSFWLCYVLKLGLFFKEQRDSCGQQEGLMGGTSRPRCWATSAVLGDLQLVTQPLCLCVLLRRRLLKPWVSTLLGSFTHWWKRGVTVAEVPEVGPDCPCCKTDMSRDLHPGASAAGSEA